MSQNFNRTLLHSRFILATSKLTTHYGASQEIVKVDGQPLQTEQSGNLRAVADFMHQECGIEKRLPQECRWLKMNPCPRNSTGGDIDT